MDMNIITYDNDADTVLCAPLLEIPIGEYSYALVDGSGTMYPGEETLTVTGSASAVPRAHQRPLYALTFFHARPQPSARPTAS